MNNIRDTKLYTKIYIKSYIVICMVKDGNTYDKLCVLKLNDMDCHVYYHIKFGASFGTQFDVPSIIPLEFHLFIIRQWINH